MLLEHDAIQTVLAAPPNMSLRELISFDEVNVNAPLLGLNIDHPKDLELLKIHATSLL